MCSREDGVLGFYRKTNRSDFVVFEGGRTMVVPSLAYDVGGTGPLLLQSWSVKCISSNHSACLLQRQHPAQRVSATTSEHEQPHQMSRANSMSATRQRVREAGQARGVLRGADLIALTTSGVRK